MESTPEETAFSDGVDFLLFDVNLSLESASLTHGIVPVVIVSFRKPVEDRVRGGVSHLADCSSMTSI